MSKPVKRLYEFGPFRIDTENRLLTRDGKPIPLKPKVVSTLLLLIENRDRVLEKDELINALWPDSFVEEGNLTQNIYVLRKALTNGGTTNPTSKPIPAVSTFQCRLALPTESKDLSVAPAESSHQKRKGSTTKRNCGTHHLSLHSRADTAFRRGS